MHRNKNRSSKCEQNSEAFCCNPNNLVFLCKTRSLTIRVIKKHVFWLNIENVEQAQKFGNLSGCVYCRPFLWALWASLPGRLPYGGQIAVRRAGRYPHQEPPCCIFQRHRATAIIHLRYDQHVLHRRLRPFVPYSGRAGRIFSPASVRYTLYYYVEFRHLTVFALYRMEIYPAQPMGGSPFRQRQRFRNGEQLEISCKTVFCQPPRFRAACNKSKSELPEFNSAEFGLIFLSAGEWIIPAYSSCGIIQRIVGKYDSKAPSS